MKIGIADLGSNTIRTVVFRLENGSAFPEAETCEFSGILREVRDGVLSAAGEETLVRALRKAREFCRLHGCEPHCFATASLRDLREPEALFQRLREASGVQVELISGRQEALYDCIGLCQEVSIQDGIGMDLGGGSCQLFQFHEGQPSAWGSFPCGNLRMYERFVRGDLPDAAEREAIRRYAVEQFESLPQLRGAGFDTLYVIGGAGRAARSLAGNASPVLTADEMRKLSFLPKEDLERQVPERLHTIVPALIIFDAACAYTGAHKIHIVANGVREGYLWAKTHTAEPNEFRSTGNPEAGQRPGNR